MKYLFFSKTFQFQWDPRIAIGADACSVALLGLNCYKEKKIQNISKNFQFWQDPYIVVGIDSCAIALLGLKCYKVKIKRIKKIKNIFHFSKKIPISAEPMHSRHYQRLYCSPAGIEIL